ncbi:N-6 DNA methylase [Nonomuraea sp. NPDC049419]|uniref:N-6 DNA methylase n=1 Tax=Nonomuraea sp. NPDC049419 TaxID=3155772 RepID=UPI00344AD8B3
MSQAPMHVTAAEISRLAGVTRATVSNWRRRHPDFPAPVAGADANPLYDLAEVRDWLSRRDLKSKIDPVEELRTLLRLRGDSSVAARLLPFVLAADRGSTSELMKLGDEALAASATKAVKAIAKELPPTRTSSFEPVDAALLRTVLKGVKDESARTVMDVLAERQLADSHSGGAYSTPQPLADLMADLLRDGDEYPQVVFDPACGGGALLEAAGRRGARHLLGQDRLDIQALRSAVRLKISQLEQEIKIVSGDSLAADAFADLRADAVLCNPPFGDRDWGHDELVYDPRWTYGVPPRGESELAWVQHALAHLVPGGHVVMLLPPSTAARTPGRKVRAELLKAGALRAIIALPPGLAVPMHVGLHLWLLRQPGPAPTGEPILMVDLSGEETGWAELTTEILSLWRTYLDNPTAFESVPGTARALPVVELFGENVDLTPIRHLHKATLDPSATARRAQQLFQQLSQGVNDLSAAVSAQLWTDMSDQPKTWRTATVEDLGKGGLLAVIRAKSSRVQPGDVLVPRVLSRQQTMVTVAGEEGAGQRPDSDVVLLRPDPARLDPWFLAGFLATEENLAAASNLRLDVPFEPRRFKVPLLPLHEQRRYGQAFQELRRLEQAAQEVWNLANETTRAVNTALAGGGLIPPDL